MICRLLYEVEIKTHKLMSLSQQSSSQFGEKWGSSTKTLLKIVDPPPPLRPLLTAIWKKKSLFMV